MEQQHGHLGGGVRKAESRALLHTWGIRIFPKILRGFRCTLSSKKLWRYYQVKMKVDFFKMDKQSEEKKRKLINLVEGEEICLNREVY